MDGNFGPRTRAAIRDWQADRGLDATGYLDSRGVDLLLSAASRDDHGDTVEAATYVELGSSTLGELETAGDADLFMLEVGTPGMLTVETTGVTDTLGYLVGSDLEELNDDDGEGMNFQIREPVSVGLYAVGVTGFGDDTGRYRLQVTYDGGASGDDHGDTVGTATRVDLDSSMVGELEVAGDRDFFLVDVPSGGMLTVETTGGTDTFGYLAGGSLEDGVEDDDDGDGTNFQIREPVSTGLYVVEVTGFGDDTGGYTVHVEHDPDEEGDDHGDDAERATRVQVESSTRGELETPGDTDVFLFDVPSAGRLTVETTGRTDTLGGILGVSDDPPVDDDSGHETNFWLQERVSPGLLGALVTGYQDATGEYTVHVYHDADPDDYGDRRETATLVELDSSRRGELEIPGDTDYFRLDVESAGTLTVETDSSLDTVGRLTDGGNLDVEDDDSGDGTDFRIREDVFPGVYFIRVRGYGGTETGNYTLRVSFEQ